MKCYQLMRASWLSFALFSYRVLATWRIECSSPADAQKISDAVGEAKKMAASMSVDHLLLSMLTKFIQMQSASLLI